MKPFKESEKEFFVITKNNELMQISIQGHKIVNNFGQISESDTCCSLALTRDKKYIYVGTGEGDLRKFSTSTGFSLPKRFMILDHILV